MGDFKVLAITNQPTNKQTNQTKLREFDVRVTVHLDIMK
jgi:hypothetical protein